MSDQVHEQLQERIAHLDRRAWNQADIAKKVSEEFGVKVTQPMVSHYLKKVVAGYRKEQQARGSGVAEERARLRAYYEEIRREALAAWEKSKEDACGTTEEYALERGDEDDGVSYDSALALVKRIETREGRLPSNPHMSIVLATLKAERELFGLDAPARMEVDHSGTVGLSIDWGSMRGRAPGQDPLKDRLLQLEGKGVFGFEPTPRKESQLPRPNPDVRFFPPEQKTDAETAQE